MINRRHLLTSCVGALGALSSTSLLAKPMLTGHRELKLYHVHTGESVNETYWENGIYNPEALSLFQHFLRDFRTGDETEIDIRLYDLLHTMNVLTEKSSRFHILSGFRSQKTNEMLRKRSRNVASKSYHLTGKAIDVHVQNGSMDYLRKAAVAMRVGGVGYYPRSKFLHLDTGPVRRW